MGNSASDGATIGARALGDLVTYTCNPGYELGTGVYDETSLCQAGGQAPGTGTWTVTAPAACAAIGEYTILTSSHEA